MLGIKKKKSKQKVQPTPETTSGLEKGVTNIKDFLSPDGAYIKKDAIQLGSGMWMRNFVIKNFPRKVSMGFLDDVYEVGDVVVSTHITPVQDYEVEKDLTAKITRLESQRIISEQKGNIARLGELEQSIQDAWQLRDAVTMNEDKMFFITVVITLKAEDKDQLDKTSKILEERLGGRSVHLRRNFLRQEQGLRSTLPLLENKIDDYRNFNLGASTALFPFTASNMAHKDGIYLGTNLNTNAPVIFDSFIGPPVMPNANINVFAQSGAGKSYTLKLMAARSALQGVRSVFIDPDGEYRALTERLGGTIVDFKPDEPALINPFDIEEETDDNGNKKVNLQEKLQDLKTTFEVMFKSNGGYLLSPEENALLDQCIMSLYSERGITRDANSLYEKDNRVGYVGYRKKEMPTISDVVNWLEEKDFEHGRRLQTLLYPFTAGHSLGLFDGQSRVQLKDVPAIDFDISHLEEGVMRPLAMHIVLSWTWEKFIKQNPHIRKLAIADEAWMFMYHEESAMFLEKMSRRVRKRNTSFCVASQSFEEFTRSQQGKAVLTNASATMLLKQSESDIDYVQEQYHLPKGQRQFLEGAYPGEALLKIGKNATLLRMDASPFEHDFVNTTPGGGDA
ncbi:VirB4 family type IV secretion system protein [Lentibacillus salinarum]|uniref:VirB4 family type IV secretion system protein n=1 Tax=Lentibacillus salinarum TaxID=446820 RepID=A0ABW3ZZ81_9BACI